MASGSISTLRSVVELARPSALPILTAAAKASRTTRTSPFSPRTWPRPERLPTTIVFRDSLIREMTDWFNSRVEQVLPPSSTRPASRELLNSLESSSLRIQWINNEANVDDYMKGVLQVAADMAQDIEQIPMRLASSEATTTAIQPRVIQKVIGMRWVGPGKEDFRTVLSDENKTPSVGRHHFTRLHTVAKNAGERGWTIPALDKCTEASGMGDLKAVVHMLNKLTFYLTDPVQPHSYALLCDAMCIYVLVKQNLNSPSFYLSPPLSLVDPNLFRILAVPFMMDPPSTITGSDSLESPPPNNTAAPLSTSHAAISHAAISMADPSSPFAPIPINHRLGDRPDKVVLLEPSHPILDDIGPIVLSSFDPAPSRATIFRGHAGTQPIVLKMAEEGRDDETREEGKVYREHLRGLEGVPKLYAEGEMLADNGQLAYCLVLEDLGVSLVSEGLGSVEDLDPKSRAQLAAIEHALHARGIRHLDLEPRNVLRTRTGGIAVIDFEEIARFPKKVSEEGEHQQGSDPILEQMELGF